MQLMTDKKRKYETACAAMVKDWKFKETRS